jgi:hypothetical protein
MTHYTEVAAAENASPQKQEGVGGELRGVSWSLG